MPTQRQLRVNNLLRDEIASIIQRDLEDPDIGFVTITGVQVSADLRAAKVFVSVLGDATAKRDSMHALSRGRFFIRGLLQDRLDLRRTPQLIFQLDETAEKAEQLSRVLREIAEESDQDDDPAE
jgi:ribosome-binding factor A